MKIAQVMPEFGLAGAEIMCENLIYELIKAGHEVVVISMYDYHSVITERLEKNGIEVLYLNKKAGLDFSMIRKIKKIFRENQVDVVHTHRYCAQYAVPAAIFSGVRHRVHTLHSVAKKENKKYARKLNKFFFKHCHLVPVALSEEVKKTVCEEYSLPESKVPTIYNGIDLLSYIQKKDYSWDNTFTLLHVGRFAQVKNHLCMLQMMKKMHVEFPCVRLWLIGDGEYKEQCIKYVKENSLDDIVTFFGLKDNVYDYMSRVDAFVLPSVYEGMPMTLIEAMASGLPIIASNVGGIPDMLENEKSALLIEPGVDALNNAVIRIVQDEELRKKLGQNALERSVEFSAEKMCKEYLKLYRGGLV